MVVILVLRRLRQEDHHECMPSLDCIATPSFKITTKGSGGGEGKKKKGKKLNKRHRDELHVETQACSPGTQVGLGGATVRVS